jgi:hypothetical protein
MNVAVVGIECSYFSFNQESLFFARGRGGRQEAKPKLST